MKFMTQPEISMLGDLANAAITMENIVVDSPSTKGFTILKGPAI